MRLSIRVKLLSFGLLIVLLVGGSISLYAIYQAREQVLKRYEAAAIETAAMIVRHIDSDLYTSNVSGLRRRLEDTHRNPDYSFIYVTDANGFILADGTRKNARRDQRLADLFSKEMMLAPTFISKTENGVLKIGGPIFTADESLIGYIQMGFSLKNAHAIITETTQNNLFITALCLAVGALLAVILSTSFARPILDIANAATDIGAGKLDIRIEEKKRAARFKMWLVKDDFPVPIPIHRSDEIGQLARSFERMVTNLKELREKDAEQTQALLTANDKLVEQISERQRAEEEVRRHNKRMQVLHEIDSAVSSTLDRRALLDAFFDKIQSLLSYSAVTIRLFDRETGRLEPIAARNLDEEDWIKIVNANAENAGCYAEEIFESRLPLVVENLQADPRSRNSEWFVKNGLVSFAGIPLMADREALGVLGFYFDEKRAIRKEEVEFLSTLGGRFAIAIENSHLYEKTKKQALELAEANNAKDEFLNVMSHELRTPLSVIGGYAQAMSLGIAGEIGNEHKKITDKIIVQANELLRMINEILQVGSLQAGSVKAYFQNTSLNDLFGELQSTFDALPKRSIGLNWDLPENMPAVRTDGDKLKHILQNLIHNAIKFTEQGTVTLSARRFGEYIEIVVRDTGIGIEEEQLPVIFDMFRQADSSKTRSHGGVGVGLFIVKKYVELLNGRIDVESKPGLGTAFTVTIPADEFAQSPEPGLQEQPARLTA